MEPQQLVEATQTSVTRPGTEEQEFIGSPGPLVIQIPEHEHRPVSADLILRDGRLDVFPSVIQKGYFTVSVKGGPLSLQAGHFIGLIPLNTRIAIDVVPRAPVSSLWRMLMVSGVAPVPLENTTRSYETAPGLPPSLVDIYAQALVRYVETIRFRGLHREYKREEHVTSFPRGRLLMGGTATRLASRGIHHQVVASWFDRTIDTGPNRCIKYAVWLLARLRRDLPRGKHDRALQTALGLAFRTFDGVVLDRSLHFLSTSLVSGQRPLPSLRSYYEPALRLAQAVISQHGVVLDGTGERLSLPSLVLDMATTFEVYLRRVLENASGTHHLPLRVWDGNHAEGQKPLLDHGVPNVATPDVVLGTMRERRRRYRLIVEAKYKATTHRAPDRDDLNQTIAYALSYGTNAAVIVQPKGDANSPELRWLGEVGGAGIYQCAFNLAAPDIHAEEERVTNLVGRIATPTQEENIRFELKRSR